MNDINHSNGTNDIVEQVIGDEEYDKLCALLQGDRGDPKILETIDGAILKRYADFLSAANEYKKSVDKGEIVSQEDRDMFVKIVETKGLKNEWAIVTLKNIKDIAYHKYLRMTWGKVAGYEYKFDQAAMGREAFRKSKNALIEGNVYMNSIYIQSSLNSGLSMDDYNGNGQYFKHSDGFNGLAFYVKNARTSIENQLKHISTYDLDIFILELRYMLEVATATHNTGDSKILSFMITFCEEAIITIQNNAFEARKQKQEHEAELFSIMQYCDKNDLKLNDIEALSKYIKELEEKNDSQQTTLNEKIAQMKADGEQNENKAKEYKQLLKNIVSQAKVSTFGSDYKIPQKLIEDIKLKISQDK